jgi:ribose 5-phosphate isomerase B
VKPGRIPVAADHAGFELKARVEQVLRSMGYEVADLGADSAVASDYPDYAHPLARQVSAGEAERGVLLCGSGIGMDIVANRYPGVRAAVIWNPELAELSRKHNDTNVLVLPARFLSEDEALAILRAWLATPFEGGRHARRVAKIDGELRRAETGAGTGAGVPGEGRSANP